MRKGIIKIYPYDPYRKFNKTWDQMGKKVKINDGEVVNARFEYKSGNFSIRDLAKLYEISYAYMYDLLSCKYRPFI